MRALLIVVLMTSAVARADVVDSEPPTGIYEPPPKNDPARWRVRALVAQGVGGAVNGVRAVTFPTELELGARLFGPLSVSASGIAVLSSREVTACGASLRPNAALGTLGLRADLRNTRSASWLDPYVEVHAGVGGQARFAEPGDACHGPRTFASGGARIGFDAWFGKIALTMQLSYDYVPVGAPLAVSIGASFILF